MNCIRVSQGRRGQHGQTPLAVLSALPAYARIVVGVLANGARTGAADTFVLRLSRGALAVVLMPCWSAHADVFADWSGIALQQLAASTTEWLPEWLPELLDLVVRALEVCSAAFLAYGAYLVVVRTLQEVVMRIGKHRLGIVPGTASRQFWTLKRGIAAAVAAVALVSLGAVLGATFAHQPGHEQVTQRENPAPTAPALEKFYVPAQHTNQATRVEEQPDAF